MLSAEQVIERKKGVGASDAKAIISGQWYDLWCDKTGKSEPKEILSPWDQMVRHVMEPIVLDDYETQTGRAVIQRGAALVHSEMSFVRCTLDGLDPEMGPIDAKALNVWTPDPIQWCIDMYTGQMQHQMAVTGFDKAALHISLGMKRPESIFFRRDEFFLNEYLEQCRLFWGYVERNEPPPGAPELSPPLPPISDMRTVDMSGSNEWAFHAADWVLHKADAKKFEEAAKSLKKLVEADVSRAHGNGIEIKRSKVGLSIKEMK